VVREHGRAGLACIRPPQPFDKVVSVEEVVAKDQRALIGPDEAAADDEGLRQAIG